MTRSQSSPISTMVVCGLLLSCVLYRNEDVSSGESEVSRRLTGMPEPTIRVLIRKGSNKDEIRLKTVGAYSIIDSDGEELYRGTSLGTTLIGYRKGGFQFGNAFHVLGESIRIRTGAGGIIQLVFPQS